MRNRARAVAACVMLLVGASIVTGPGAGAIPASKCTGVLTISSVAFGPGTVVPGLSSTARLTAMNCTHHTQSFTVTWLGRYVGSDVTGCPVIDPLAQPISVASRATLRAHLAYTVPKTCAATSLAVTARIAAKGKVVAHKTGSLRIAHTRKITGA